MKRKLIIVLIGSAVAVCTWSAFAGEKVDVSTVITKAEAEKILGVPVKDPKGTNKEGNDGFYDSEWSYRAVNGDKTLVLDLLVAGRDAPPNLTKTMFSVLPPNGGKSTKVDGLGEKAIFYHDKSGLDMLNIPQRRHTYHNWDSRFACNRRPRTGKSRGDENSGAPLASPDCQRICRR